MQRLFQPKRGDCAIGQEIEVMTDIFKKAFQFLLFYISSLNRRSNARRVGQLNNFPYLFGHPERQRQRNSPLLDHCDLSIYPEGTKRKKESLAWSERPFPCGEWAHFWVEGRRQIDDCTDIPIIWFRLMRWIMMSWEIWSSTSVYITTRLAFYSVERQKN